LDAPLLAPPWTATTADTTRADTTRADTTRADTTRADAKKTDYGSASPAVAPAADVEDEQLAAYNRMLALLAREDESGRKASEA
jgi:hypothetical protein